MLVTSNRGFSEWGDVFAILDQKQRPGQVSVRIVWQTGAVSEHWVRRRVHGYDQHADFGRLEQRIRALNGAGNMDAAIAAALNAEGLLTAKGTPFNGALVHLLRRRWGIPTVKINGTAPNPDRWPDGTYSIQGVAKAVGVTAQTVFDWLKVGLLTGVQSMKGQPWQIVMSEETCEDLRQRITRTRRSRKVAS
ncbi:hypothetical protein ABAZ39_11835 [Azospirillum argentinense]|uniref:Uncharacterized protein n=1 Tax=Azospirillum argentinense TaxID=2970906 RepID=A0A060DNH1_9PROT|nr:hypothetical protein [Azospirillum argentinense]AIB12668.1 hypothetical protein ABAZ39_11835 [Azospirillum argentinense]EZQ09450.1 hypothetical protein ABAZ39_13260 [Azospirillum argentinense]